MHAIRLEDRFRDALSAQGTLPDPESLIFAADFARLAVRALMLSEPREEERRCLTRAIQTRTAFDDDQVALLLGLALSPEFRAAVSPDELRAYAARFGEEAALALQAEDEADLDLSGFTVRYGTGEALLLLDTLFAVASADGRICDSEVERLRVAANDLGVDEVLVGAMLRKHDARHASGELFFPVESDRMVIGRAGGCDIVLPDPQVALRHAELVCVNGVWRVVDLGSGRPTVVNGAPVTSAPLPEGSEVRVGPYSLRLSPAGVVVDGTRSFSALSVRHLTRHIGDISLLDDVSFTVFSGEVIALVGPSGSGKTTLLNAINGVAPADSGEVLLDGRPFHAMLAADPSLVGIVPQDDLVNPELRVDESLFYSGRLRFSPDVSDAEIHREVERVLGELGIAHIKKNRIGDALRRGISGGQRKRVNLGQELMTRSTRLLFLDEPTSGLDPRAAQDIVRLARQLADSGRIVFLVTHDLTPEVMAQVDHLCVLAQGGRLAYCGPPGEACSWFGVKTPDAIFNRFGDRPPEEWGRLYREGRDYRKYVATREHLLGLDSVATGSSDGVRSGGRSAGSQLRTLVRRYTKVKLRDRTGLAVLGVQPPILALVMWLVFPQPTYPLAFMLALSALWFGMSASVRELIADRIIWRRERRVGVGVAAYMGSKVLVLGAIVALQCIALTTMVHVARDLGDWGFSLPLLCVVSVLTGWSGMTLGLAVGGVWDSSEAAVGTLPILIIPQIMFSGIMVPLGNMNRAAEAITKLTVDRFAFDAVIKTGEKLSYLKYGEWKRQAISGPLYDLGFKPAGAQDFGLSLAELCAVIGAHGVIYLCIATALVWRRDRDS